MTVIKQSQFGIRYGAAATVLGFASLAAPAGAQSSEGPVTQIDISFDLRHDSNIARASPDRAALRGLEQLDERLTLGANLKLERPLGRNTLKLHAFVGYDIYRRNTRLNRERIAIAGDLRVEAGPCTIDVAPQFERKQSELSSISIIAVPGIASVENTQTTQTYHAEVACGRSGGIRPLASYEYGRGDNSNVVRRISDYRKDRVSLGVRYANPVLGRYAITAERENVDYPNRAATGLAGLKGYKLDQLRLSVARSIGAVLVADGSIAYGRLTPETASAPGFEGLSWSLGATTRPLPQFRLRLGLAQALSPALGAEALYARNRDLTADAAYALSPRTTLTLSGSRSTRDYRGATATLGPLLRNDRLDQLVGGIEFKSSARLRFRLEAGREKRNANGAVYDYRNSFVALNTLFSLGSP